MSEEKPFSLRMLLSEYFTITREGMNHYLSKIKNQELLQRNLSLRSDQGKTKKKKKNYTARPQSSCSKLTFPLPECKQVTQKQWLDPLYP